MHNYREHILIVDDEIGNLVALQKILEKEAYRVDTATSAQLALKIFKERGADIMVTDLKMPKMSGLELLREIRKLEPKMPVLLLTAFGTVDDAVEAMKLGAVDFLTKPVKKKDILKSIQDCSKKIEYKKTSSKNLIIGDSLQMTELKKTIKILAPTQASVFIEGESGTGKELVAKMVHIESGRKGELVCLNCGAIPESLLESELFGYEKGAFTGANNAKPGLIELANEGTLFLDEIGEMPIGLQVKMLRVLQNGEFFRLGAVKSSKSNVRIVAATNANIEEKIRIGEFREDLFFRLNVVNLALAPLRKRGADCILLANYFLYKAQSRYDKKDLFFSEEAIDLFRTYNWPGNVRELENVVERAVVLTESKKITKEKVRISNKASVEKRLLEEGSIKVEVGTSLKEMESLLIKQTLEKTGGNKVDAAKLLGINLRTIYRKISE